MLVDIRKRTYFEVLLASRVFVNVEVSNGSLCYVIEMLVFGDQMGYCHFINPQGVTEKISLSCLQIDEFDRY